MPRSATPEIPARFSEVEGLTYVTDTDPGLSRRRVGRGFRYFDANSHPVTDKPTLARIRALGIPPAWKQVWISPTPDGHIQATGRDARDRKQYRYHASWNEARDLGKYGHMLEFARLLPKLRRRIRTDMATPGMGRNKILATVINLLETTLIRVGNEDYVKQNKSYGLSTLRNRHVQVKSDEMRFRFTGKSGKEWDLRLTDRRLARIVKACQDLPGQHLFQYLDEDGQRHAVTSQDVNSYLREVTGTDVTAKDFRTWAGTVLATQHLRKAEAATSVTAAKRTISSVIKAVAAKLGNTPAICRKCYVHPDVFLCYQQGRLGEDLATLVEKQRPRLPGLRLEEATVVILLGQPATPSKRKPMALLQAA